MVGGGRGVPGDFCVCQGVRGLFSLHLQCEYTKFEKFTKLVKGLLHFFSGKYTSFVMKSC